MLNLQDANVNELEAVQIQKNYVTLQLDSEIVEEITVKLTLHAYSACQYSVRIIMLAN